MIAAISSSDSRKLVGAQRSNVSAYSRTAASPRWRMSAMIPWTRWLTSSWAVSANDLVCAVFRWVGMHGLLRWWGRRRWLTGGLSATYVCYE